MAKHKLKLLLIAVIIAVIIAVPVMNAGLRKDAEAERAAQMCHISVWQIDGFEGGRGSRSGFLQACASRCFDGEKVYVTVDSLSADAARENLATGNVPDIISYPSGFYGIENLINRRDFTFKSWCRGIYCVLSLDTNTDFSDVKAENTVINAGKDNLTMAAALLHGVGAAPVKQPTEAYLQLINGKAKYLFGTQRDIFRLKTRNVPFTVKAVEEFNDLYQEISILTTDVNRYNNCKKMIDCIQNDSKIGSLGLFSDGGETIAEEMNGMKDCAFDHVLNSPCSEEYILAVKDAVKNNDVNKLKLLLK